MSEDKKIKKLYKREKPVEINTDNNKSGTVILDDGFDIPIKNKNKTINEDKKIKKLTKKIFDELVLDSRRFNITIDIDVEEIPPSKTIFQEALEALDNIPTYNSDGFDYYLDGEDRYLIQKALKQAEKYDEKSYRFYKEAQAQMDFDKELIRSLKDKNKKLEALIKLYVERDFRMSVMLDFYENNDGHKVTKEMKEKLASITKMIMASERDK